MVLVFSRVALLGFFGRCFAPAIQRSRFTLWLVRSAARSTSDSVRAGRCRGCRRYDLDRSLSHSAMDKAVQGHSTVRGSTILGLGSTVPLFHHLDSCYIRHRTSKLQRPISYVRCNGQYGTCIWYLTSDLRYHSTDVRYRTSRKIHIVYDIVCPKKHTISYVLYVHIIHDNVHMIFVPTIPVVYVHIIYENVQMSFVRTISYFQ